MRNLITLPWRLFMRAVQKVVAWSEREVARAAAEYDPSTKSNDEVDIWVESGR